MFRMQNLDIGRGGSKDNRKPQQQAQQTQLKPASLTANSFAARIGKGSSLSIKQATTLTPVSASTTAATPAGWRKGNIAKLANNPLFAALQGDRSKKQQPAKQQSAKQQPANQRKNPLQQNIQAVSRTANSINTAEPSPQDRKFEIKGSSGKSIVKISNLAPGTSENDMAAFLESLGMQVDLFKMFVERDGSVTTETVFANRANAEACISQIDNALADGGYSFVSKHRAILIN